MKIPLIIINTENSLLCGNSVNKYYPETFSVRFVDEGNSFIYDLGKLLHEINTTSFAICSDKSVFYRYERFEDWNINIFPGEVFSFRYGLNTVLQDTKNKVFQPSLNRYAFAKLWKDKQKNIISWDSLEYLPQCNYGYPLSLDGHVYNKEQFLSLISKFEWNSKQSLEIGLQNYRHNVRYIRSFSQSIMFNLLSQSIELDKIAIEKVNGCHHFAEDVLA